MIRGLMIAWPNVKCSQLSAKRYVTQLSRNSMDQNFDEYAAGIRAVKAETGQKLLKVTWNDGFESKFPYVWLLDSARFSTDDAGRLSLNELSLDAEPQHLALSQDGRRVAIRWFPYREALYDSDWLKGHARRSDQRSLTLRHPVVTWGRAQLEPRRLMLHAADLTSNSSEVPETMAQFAKYGVLVIRGCLDVDQVLRELRGDTSDADDCQSFEAAPLRLDRGFVQGLRTACAAAGSSPPPFVALHVNKLPPNDDASVQLVDGFRVAEQLQEVHPTIFNFLCTMAIQYTDDKERSAVSRPVFTLSATGEVTEVAFDNSLRASKLMHSPQNANRFYEALKVFNAYCYQSRNLLNLHVQEGDAVLLDNRRVLYGHADFLSTTGQAMIRETYFGDIFSGSRWREFI